MFGFIGLVAAAVATELTALLYLSGLWKKREKLIRYADFGVVADLMDALAEAKTMRFNLMTDLKKRSPRGASASSSP